jgi:nicotinate phosphoribosyltransferase
MAAKLPIDSFGVGTDLATSADSPNLGAIYKMVELDSNGSKRYTAKFAGEKSTIPGAKQVFRFSDHDKIALESECYADAAEALLKPVILNGELVDPLPGATAAREYAGKAIRKLPKPLRTAFEREGGWRVEYSLELKRVLEQVRASKHT